jgi:hypothetical protein
MGIYRIFLIILFGAWLNMLNAADFALPQSWIATNSMSAKELAANYFTQIDLTITINTNVPHYDQFSSSSFRPLLRTRESVILRALAYSTYGGKVMANYDIKSGVAPDGLTQPELLRIWETNRTLFKVSYYRGRIYYLDKASYSDEWITVFASDDKRRIVFARDSGPIFFSGNSGVSWTSITQSGNYEFTLSTSPKGSIFVAALSCTNISRAMLTDEKMVNGSWYAAVSDADGSKLVLSGGTSQPSPVISINRSDDSLTLSWSSSFRGFTLQQNDNLETANWIDVTNNVEQVESQFIVKLPVDEDHYFFRLKGS